MTSNSWSLSLITALLRKSPVDQIKPFTYDLGRRSLTVAEYPILIETRCAMNIWSNLTNGREYSVKWRMMAMKWDKV